MACFLACFGGAKERKLRKKRGRKTSPNNNRANRVSQTLETSPSPQKAAIEAVVDVPADEIREKHEKQVSPKIYRKKVTFDPNVKTYELVAVDQDINESVELESVETLKEESAEESKLKRSPDPNYRYNNCDSSDDDEFIDDEDEDEEDIEDEEYEDFDIEDEVAIVANGEESYESYFSIPINKEKQQQQQEQNSEDEAVDSPIPTTKTSSRDRSQYVHNVLNPVENLTQWKEVKTRGLPLKNQNKENISSNLESTEAETPPKKQELSVDASLSTWLSEASVKSNSNWSNSPVSKEEQPILGALTIDDLKHSSVTSSPRKSPCRNFDDTPIVGSVGSYWNSQNSSDVKGIPNSTSKYREDKRVNWHSSPFEARLERALSKGTAT